MKEGSILDNPLIIVIIVLVLVLAGVLFFFLRKKNQANDNDVGYDTIEQHSPVSVPPVINEQVTASPVVAPVEQAQTPTQPTAPTVGTEIRADDFHIEKTFELSDSGWESGQAAEVSVAQVDDLTEYKVYKQFGYFNKAANSLRGYLSLQENKPKELVFELCGMYLEAGELDNFVLALEEFHDQFNRDELEDVVRMGFELEPDNLNLRVFAEEKLNWGVEEVARDVVKEDGFEINITETKPVVDEVVENNFQSTIHYNNREAYFSKLDDAKQLVRGFKRVFGIDADERETIVAFSSGEKAVRLLGKEIGYAPAVNLYNRVIPQAKRPAAIIIDVLNMDYQHRDINNYAEHLWNLYSILGKYGRLVKEKMLGWGYSLGQHPLFNELEDAPNEIELREIGIKYGYLIENASNVKAKMLPLVTEVRDIGTGYAANEVEEIMQEAEGQLMYGQIDEAIDTLEKGVAVCKQESQLYTMLLDLYERSENWKRFEAFSIKIRSEGVELPEEVRIALSNLTQRMTERG